MALGGVLFLVFLARPLAPRLGRRGPAIAARHRARSPAGARVALVLSRGRHRRAAGRRADRTRSICRSRDVLTRRLRRRRPGEDRRRRAASRCCCSAGASARRLRRCWRSPLIELAAATLTTHAAARLDDRGAAAGRRVPAPARRGDLDRRHPVLPAGAGPGATTAPRWRLVGARFSRMSMVGVACILVSGVDHERVLYRQLARLLRHRLRRHGRRQDRHVPDAAGAGRR